MRNKTKPDLSKLRTLFHLFIRTHSAHRACILISVNLKMSVEEIESLLHKEILKDAPVRKAD
jgi:hypothetical protein